MSERTYAAVMKTRNGYYLMLSRKDGVVGILGWTHLQDALSYFTACYDSNHRRSYEASMSACINYIEFHPRILEFNGLQDMIDKLKLTPNEHVVRISSISGSYEVMSLNEELVKPLYDDGIRPNLMTR